MTMLDVFIAQLQGAHDHIANTLQGLTDEQINYRPSANAHNIGFAIWHTLRTWDAYFARITKMPSVYERENWAVRFGFDAHGRGISDVGTGFTAQDIAAMPLTPETLNAFLESLWTHTRDDLKMMNDDVLLREAIVPWWNPPTIPFARVMSHIIAHTYLHIGEADYVRGLLGK